MNLAERVNLNLQLLNGQNELNLFVLKESLTYLKLLKSPKFLTNLRSGLPFLS